jgi:hypothetical protein
MPKLGSRAAARKEAIAQKASRPDPVHRNFDGSANWTKLKGQDPNRKYVLAYNGHSETGVEYYQDLGYDIERAAPGGVGLGAGKVASREGEPIIMRGHTLMSISKEDHSEIVQHGEDGQTGQTLFDEIEKRIVAGGGTDSFRGQIPDHMSVRINTAEPNLDEG